MTLIPQSTILILIAAAALFFVIAIILVFMYGRNGGEQSHDQLEKFRLSDHAKRRLLSPLWNELEKHFEMPIPEPIRRLYSNQDLILRTDFFLFPPGKFHSGQQQNTRDGFHILQFRPADIATQKHILPSLRRRLFAFAEDLGGCPYFVELDGNPNSPLPVEALDRETRNPIRIAASLDEFLAWDSLDFLQWHKSNSKQT